MALIVEDGTGKPDADAFVSVEDCTAYCEAQGLTGWTSAAHSPAADDEAAIRRATRWLSTTFAWKGVRLKGRGQALAFPRIDATDREGEAVPSDEVPVEIVSACCIAATYERENPGALTPSVTMAERVKRERIDVIDTEYFAAPATAEAARPVVLAVNDLIGGLISGSANGLIGRAERC